MASVSALIPDRCAAATVNPPAAIEVTALSGQTRIGPIFGGVTMAANGRFYVSAAAGNGHSAQARAWNANNTLLWSWASPDGADFKAIPLLGSNAALLFVASDSGRVYCLDAPNSDAALQSLGQTRLKWVAYLAGVATGVRARAPLALNPEGTRLYVHTDGPDGGHLHALKTSDGTPDAAWGGPKNTGNTGCSPYGPYHSDPAMIFSSGPVVNAAGQVFAASSSGWVYGWNAGGSLILAVNLNAALLNGEAGQTTGVEIEASPALGATGWLYVATRRYEYQFDASSSGPRQSLVAINPAEPGSQKIRWVRHLTSWDQPASPGVLAAPVLDRAGFVYTADLGHSIEQFDAIYGTPYRNWYTTGKLCATPTLTEDGLVLMPQSGVGGCGYAGLLALRAYGAYDLNFNAPSLWEYLSPDLPNGAGGCNGTDLFGAPAVRANGWIYYADSGGRVFRVAGTTPMMEGPWPTLSGGNRRAGLVLSYPWQITELFGAYDINWSLTYPSIATMDAAGRTYGNCYGTFAGGQPGTYAGTYWNPLSAQFATYNGSGGGYYSQNTRCEAANTYGDIVGGTPNSPANALVWPLAALPGASVPYVTLSKPAGGQAYANGISETRMVVGYTINGSVVKVARWSFNGSTWPRTDVPGPAGNQAYALACGISGDAIGMAKFETPAGAPFRAFRLNANQPAIISSYDLGTLADTPTQREYTRSSEAYDIREDRGIVGRSQNISGIWRAFSIPLDGVMTDQAALPGLLPGTAGTWTSRADSLNRLGIKVGTAQTNNPGGGGLVNRAVMWDVANAITDLNALLPVGSGWVLTSAVAVNDGGFIIGYGTRNGTTRPFLLAPQRNVN